MEKLRVGFTAPNQYERQRINEAADEINHLTRDAAGVQKQVLRLLELDRDQGREIAKLEAVVYTLMQMLVESGALDATSMNERIGAAIAKLEAEPAWNRMRGA